MNETLKVYKGTDKDMKCRGMQYELGKTYESDDAIRCGSKGFHSCEAPMDVFNYYHPSTGARYFAAEADGKVDRTNADDSKVASSKLTLKTEIGIPGIVKAQIEYVKSKTTMEHTDPKQATAGNWGAATAGNSGAATAGYKGAATAGNWGAATAGYKGAATAGNSGAATAGNSGAATAGYKGAATAGDSGAATAGNSGAATAGDSGAATAGDSGVATAGYKGAATAGNWGAATAGNSGAATAGYKGAATTGENGIAVCNGGKVRGGLGAVLVIAERDDEGNYLEAKVAHVDGETIKADTWYRLKDGQFVEVE